jgi:hypothetical protein
MAIINTAESLQAWQNLEVIQIPNFFIKQWCKQSKFALTYREITFQIGTLCTADQDEIRFKVEVIEVKTVFPLSG